MSCVLRAVMQENEFKKYGLKCPIRKSNSYRRMPKAVKTDGISNNLVNRGFFGHMKEEILLERCTRYSDLKAEIDEHMDFTTMIDINGA